MDLGLLRLLRLFLLLLLLWLAARARLLALLLRFGQHRGVHQRVGDLSPSARERRDLSPGGLRTLAAEDDLRPLGGPPRRLGRRGAARRDLHRYLGGVAL